MNREDNLVLHDQAMLCKENHRNLGLVVDMAPQFFWIFRTWVDLFVVAFDAKETCFLLVLLFRVRNVEI
jgi:hypothetical protein